MLAMLRSLGRDLRGATAVEYGLIVALIVIAMVTSFTQFGNAASSMWTDVHEKIGSATGN